MIHDHEPDDELIWEAKLDRRRKRQAGMHPSDPRYDDRLDEQQEEIEVTTDLNEINDQLGRAADEAEARLEDRKAEVRAEMDGLRAGEATFRDALARAENTGRADDHPALTFVSPGPVKLPIRPRLLEHREDGSRVYSATLKQVRKMVALMDAAREQPTKKENDEHTHTT